MKVKKIYHYFIQRINLVFLVLISLTFCGCTANSKIEETTGLALGLKISEGINKSEEGELFFISAVDADKCKYYGCCKSIFDLKYKFAECLKEHKVKVMDIDKIIAGIERMRTCGIIGDCEKIKEELESNLSKKNKKDRILRGYTHYALTRTRSFTANAIFVLSDDESSENFDDSFQIFVTEVDPCGYVGYVVLENNNRIEMALIYSNFLIDIKKDAKIEDVLW